MSWDFSAGLGTGWANDFSFPVLFGDCTSDFESYCCHSLLVDINQSERCNWGFLRMLWMFTKRQLRVTKAFTLFTNRASDQPMRAAGWATAASSISTRVLIGRNGMRTPGERRATVPRHLVATAPDRWRDRGPPQWRVRGTPPFPRQPSACRGETSALPHAARIAWFVVKQERRRWQRRSVLLLAAMWQSMATGSTVLWSVELIWFISKLIDCLAVRWRSDASHSIVSASLNQIEMNIAGLSDFWLDFWWF